ncbi:hypothetical protein C6500_10485 [Candidatus Poribacteria bacterium]|nr:MAG: hypothetical protein C6500_10485 [Candidatus Poribacteria bacterium]
MRGQMKFRQYFTIWVFLLCGTTTMANALSDSEIKNSIVFISTEHGIGSGFFVAPYRILTGLHLVEGLTGNKIKMKWGATNNEIKFVRIAETLPDHLLVVLEVDTHGSVLSFADGNTIQPNDPIYVADYPTGEKLFKKKEWVIYPEPIKNCKVQIKLPLVIESSGGPLLNIRGEVVAIHFAGLAIGKRLNSKFSFAIPINAVSHWLQGEYTLTPVIPLGDPCKRYLRRLLRGNAAARKAVWLENAKYIDDYLHVSGDGFAKHVGKARNFFKQLGHNIPWKTLRKVFLTIF